MRTFTQFINDPFVPESEWVEEIGFNQLYVRKCPFTLDNIRYPTVIIIANVEVERKGKGTFTNFLNKILIYKRPIVVENVLSKRFENYFISRNWIELNRRSRSHPSFVKLVDTK